MLAGAPVGRRGYRSVTQSCYWPVTKARAGYPKGRKCSEPHICQRVSGAAGVGWEWRRSGSSGAGFVHLVRFELPPRRAACAVEAPGRPVPTAEPAPAAPRWCLGGRSMSSVHSSISAAAKMPGVSRRVAGKSRLMECTDDIYPPRERPDALTHPPGPVNGYADVTDREFPVGDHRGCSGQAELRGRPQRRRRPLPPIRVMPGWERHS